ncbi:unnamed protein product [Mycena citricolor]|nr:unnamed protein product [Mycena citricolor]
MAEKHGIYLLLSLTNNWNPLPTDNLTDTTHPAIAKRDVLTNNSLPRNSLSNDYGGMDAYVRSFGGKTHDEFYVNETMITAFEHYITQLVSRYVNNASVLAWEVANDPRCTSSLNSTSSCNTTTLTLWHERIATHISSIDPNHLVSSGTQGFLCADCPKVNKQPTTPSPSRPQPSSGSAKRQNVPSPLTRARVLQERKAARKVTRALRLKSEVPSGVRVRGKWVATPTVRQDNSVGSAFDGSTGVDSGDILDIAQIGFGSFQLFPDQNQYAPDDPNLPAFNNTVQAGLQWIRMHSQSSQTANKPIIMSGFGLVTQESAPSFVPFNSTVAPFANDQIGNVTLNPGVAPYGVTDPQRNDAYMQWLQQGIASGLAGIIQYQWGQGNLTTANGTAIAPTITENGIEPVQNSTGVSPSDGYSIVGVGQESVQNVIQQAAQQFAPN